VATASTLLIRPIQPDDKDRLVEGFGRLSDRSRYQRFLSPHAVMSPSELRYFTEVDHHDHEALVALDTETEMGVGVARYVRSATDPAVAELAVTVVDDWQGKGVGGRLTAALADRARAEGITSFSALVLAENEQILNLLEDLGSVREVAREQGTVELTVELPARGLGPRLRRVLRAVASGDIIPFGRDAPEAHDEVPPTG
jgi:GNAT superfamily N-acetyltransferase